MLTKDDLLGLGISPGPVFGEIFKAIKSCKTKEEAVDIAIAIRDGTFVRPERKTTVIDPDSVLHWLLDFKLCPSSEGSFPASKSERRRMLEQGAVTIDGKKPKGEDMMPLDPWEVTFFKGSKAQCSVWFDITKAPIGATWRFERNTGLKDDKNKDIIEFLWNSLDNSRDLV